MKNKHILFCLFVCGLFYHSTVFAEESETVEIGSSQVSLTVTKPEDEEKTSQYFDSKIQISNHSNIHNNYLPRTNEANYQSLTMSILDIYIMIGSLVVLIINKKRKKEEKMRKKTAAALTIGGLLLVSQVHLKTVLADETPKSDAQIEVTKSSTPSGEVGFVVDSDNIQSTANLVFAPFEINSKTNDTKEVLSEKKGTQAIVKLNDNRTNVVGKGGFSVKVSYGTDTYKTNSFSKKMNFKMVFKPSSIENHGTNTFPEEASLQYTGSSYSEPVKLFEFAYEKGVKDRQVALNSSLEVQKAKDLEAGTYGATLNWTMVPILE